MKESIRNFIGGMVFAGLCLFAGFGIASWVLQISGWHNLYFYNIIALIYAGTLAYRFDKDFNKYWKNSDWMVHKKTGVAEQRV